MFFCFLFIFFQYFFIILVYILKYGPQKAVCGRTSARLAADYRFFFGGFMACRYKNGIFPDKIYKIYKNTQKKPTH